MKSMRECSLRNHPNRESIEELCCLSVIGDLSREDRIFLEGHLKECEECRDLVQGFERIALFELPAVASLRTENFVPESLELTNESRIRTRVLERVKAGLEREEIPDRITQDKVPPCPTSWLRHVKRGTWFAVAAGGWAAAALVLVWMLGRGGPVSEESLRASVRIAPPSEVTGDLNLLKKRVDLAERRRDEALKKLEEAQALNRNDALSLAQMTSQFEGLNAAQFALKNQQSIQEDQLRQRAAELALLRNDLREQSAEKESLQGQLSEVYDRLEQNRAEAARLERTAATTPARVPTSAQDIGASEAKEILGARDLHLVDVFDVDDAGKSSRAYGRVYYLNHNLLVFYAFDLSKLERNHKAVAFQAWGFRQPQSTKAESLGLFYMDNAMLNRWSLRISDPQILSRIDTLFVTVEPPGGSPFPKGRRLLMASLAGPANHP
jgi:hypothetical protein